MKTILSTAEKKGGLFLILLLLLVSIPFLPVLFGGGERVLSNKSADIAGQFYAYKYFIHEELQAGRLPLWNPYLMSGTNFLGEGQPGLFYPTTWLFVLFSPGTAINLHFLVHALLTAAAFFCFLNQLGLSKESSFLGSLVFAFSSVPVLRIYPGHFPNYPFLALAPLFLLFWERFLQSRSLKNLLFMSLIYACLVFSGHAQFLFYFSIFFLGYALWSTLNAKEGAWKEKGKKLLAFGFSILLGIILSSVQLLPSLDFAGNSFRYRMSYEFCSTFSFAPENFLTFLYPSFFGDRIHSPYWGRNYLWEMEAYLGVIPLLSAILGALYFKHPRKVFFLTAVPFFSLLALGSHTPLFSFLYRFVPFFDSFRGSSKFITLVVMSLSILAAFGFEAILQGHKTQTQTSLKKKLKTAATFSLALALISGALFWTVSSLDTWKELVQWRYTKGEIYEEPILQDEDGLLSTQGIAKRSIGLTGLLAFALFVCLTIVNRNGLKAIPALRLFLFCAIIGDLLFFGWKYYDTFAVREIQVPQSIVEYLSKDKDLYRVLAPFHPANSFMPSKIESIGGYAGNILERYNRFLNRAQGNAEETLQSYVDIPRYSPVLNLLGVKYLILPSEINVEGPIFHRLRSTDDLTLYQNGAYLPRIYFPRRIRFVNSSAEALKAVAGSGFDPRDLSIVEDQIRAGETIDYGEDALQFQVRKYSPNEIQLEVQSPRTRVAVLANSFDPNWKASIDGRSTDSVMPANYVLQAFLIPQGSHIVTLSFFPNSLRTGMILTGAGLLAWVLIWIWGRREEGVNGKRRKQIDR